ncbi:LysR substrate-binding domain-containing protein [Cryptosporangium minutisporangium]
MTASSDTLDDEGRTHLAVPWFLRRNRYGPGRPALGGGYPIRVSGIRTCGSSLAPRKPVDRLRDEPFVCLPGRSGMRGLLDSAPAAAGFQPHIRLEAHSPTSIRGLVSAGLGVALLARSTTESPGPPIAVYRTPALPPHPPIGLIHHRDHRLPRRASLPTAPGRPFDHHPDVDS